MSLLFSSATLPFAVALALMIEAAMFRTSALPEWVSWRMRRMSASGVGGLTCRSPW